MLKDIFILETVKEGSEQKRTSQCPVQKTEKTNRKTGFIRKKVAHELGDGRAALGIVVEERLHFFPQVIK